MSDEINATHEWRKIQDFVPGDFIHRWGDDLEVVNVTVYPLFVILSYKDGEEIVHMNTPFNGQYIARKREVS